MQIKNTYSPIVHLPPRPLNPSKLLIGRQTSQNIQTSFFSFTPQTLQLQKHKQNLTNPSCILHHNNLIYITENKQDGTLVILNSKYQIIKSVSTFGKNPSHVCVDPLTGYLAVTNYGSGSIAIFQTSEKEGIAELKGFIMHEGQTGNNEKQNSPHPSCCIISKNTLFVSDLGTDTIYAYTLCLPGSKSLSLQKESSLILPSAGPKFISASTNSSYPFIYVSCSLDSSIYVISYSNNKLETVVAYRVSSNINCLPTQMVCLNDLLFMCNKGDSRLIVFQMGQNGTLQEKLQWKVGEGSEYLAVSNGIIYVGCDEVVERYKLQDGKVFQLGSIKVNRPTCLGLEQSY